MPRERLLTHHKRKVLRKRISTAETLFGALFILLVGMACLWVLAQSDNFDPGDRDISFEVLQKESAGEELYTPPLQRWTEPGSVAAAAGLPDVSPFPSGILADGWELDGRVELYDESNVYEKINGAAEQYRAFGFQSLTYVTLARDEHFLNFELYDQGEFKNVLGVFAAQRAESRQVQILDEIYFYETSVGVIGGYRNIYFKVAGNSEAGPIRAKARDFVGMILEMPASATPPPRAFTILTRDLGISFDGIEYRKQDVFQYDFLSDFWFGQVAGESEAKLFIHEAADATTAAGLFDLLQAEQAYEYSVVEGGEGRAVMEHEFLESFFGLRRSGAYLFGVEGATTRDAAVAALGTLGEVLNLEG